MKGHENYSNAKGEQRNATKPSGRSKAKVNYGAIYFDILTMKPTDGEEIIPRNN